MIETSSFVSFLKIREKWSESKVTAKTKGSEYQLVSINPHGLITLNYKNQPLPFITIVNNEQAFMGRLINNGYNTMMTSITIGTGKTVLIT